MEENNQETKKEDFFEKYYLYIFFAVLAISLYLRLRYYSINTAIWYDEGAYLNMAKRIGLNLSYLNDDFYFRRTFLLPLLFALFYKIAGNTETLFRLSMLLFSFGAVIFSYLLIREMFDRRYALLSMIVLGVSWMHLFFTARFLTNVPSLFFMTAGLYFFWKGYANNQQKYNVYLAGIFFGLGLFTRLDSLMMLFPVFIYVIAKEKMSFLKNKQLWLMFVIILLILTPFFINFFSYKAEGSGVGGFLKHYFLDRDFQALDYLLKIGYILSGLYIFLFVFGLSYFIDLFLGIDSIFRDEEIRKKLFVFLWILTPIIMFGLITSLVEERYLMLTLPFLSFLVAYACVKITSYLKLSKNIAFFVILLLLIIGSYSQVSLADSLIKNKKDSFIQLKYAGEWLKQNTKQSDYIISSGQPELMYYSERNIESFTSTEEQFQAKIDKLKPKYMIITALEPSPEWTYAYPEKHQNQLKPVMGYFFDSENKQPAVIIFEFLYNATK